MAKTAGFCFGVERAVSLTRQAAKEQSHIYTYGPIIHNQQVVEELEKQGVQILAEERQLSELEQATVIIRSHGAPKSVYDRIAKQQLALIDATCPFVLKIHRIVKEQSQKGRTIVLLGDREHPEVIGIKGWCESKIEIISTLEQAKEKQWDKTEKLCLVAQTTFHYKKFQDIVEMISKKGYDILVFNTICSATRLRQQEASDIAKRVDAMIVVGSQNSSNTQKLYQICKKECKNTYNIETYDDLEESFFQSVRSVGITAGASTPNNIIKEVQTACQK